MHELIEFVHFFQEKKDRSFSSPENDYKKH